MDLEDLRSFQVLAEELSFTAAARRLHVSQPSLSRRLQRLERRLGLVLLDRTTSTVSLTPAGSWFLARSTALLGQWQAVAAGGPAERPGDRTPVRIAVPALGSGALAPYLAAAMPAHRVSVTAVPVPVALVRLGAGDGLDAVLVNDPPGIWTHPPAPGAHVATVLREPLWVMVGTRHPLAAREELSVEVVVEHDLPWIVGPRDDPIGEWEGSYLRGMAPRARLHWITDGSQVEIARGRAAALATPLHPPNELLTLRPLTPEVTMHVYLTWQPHRLPAAVAAELLTAVRGFHRHRSQSHPRYRRWLRDRPGRFPGVGPDLPAAAAPAPVLATAEA